MIDYWKNACGEILCLESGDAFSIDSNVCAIKNMDPLITVLLFEVSDRSIGNYILEKAECASYQIRDRPVLFLN
jgi:hypothetical protein